MNIKHIGPGYRLSYRGRIIYCMNLSHGIRRMLGV